ncbi:GAF domain-containing protein [Streptomyces sp. NPDC006207]
MTDNQGTLPQARALIPGGNQHGHDLLDAVPRVAAAIFGAASSSILLLDRERDELVFCSVSNPDERELVGTRFPAGRGIAGWVVSAMEPLIVDDVRQLEVFASDVAQATGHLPEAMMAVPLLYDGDVLGVLEVIDPAPQSRSSLNELELLALFAQQAAISLHTLLSETGPVAQPPDSQPLAFLGLTPDEREVGLRIFRALQGALGST